MKVLVCISHVPDTTSKINFTPNYKAFDKNGIQFIINPHDEFTLTYAIGLKQTHGAQVTVVHVGASDSENSLRKALAMGADTAVRIDAVAEQSYFVAEQIANLVKQEKFDLILTGKESIDYNGGMVGGMLSGILGLPFINNCVGLQIKDQKAVAIREAQGVAYELAAPLPVVVAGQKGLVEQSDLKIPSIRGIMMARKKVIKIIAPVATSPSTKTILFEKPQENTACQMIDSKNLDAFIEILHKDIKLI